MSFDGGVFGFYWDNTNGKKKERIEFEKYFQKYF